MMKSGLGAATRAVPKHLCNQLCNELPNMKPLLPYTGTEFLDSLDEHTEEYRRDLRRVEYGDERDPVMRKFIEDTAPLNNTTKMT